MTKGYCPNLKLGQYRPRKLLDKQPSLTFQRECEKYTSTAIVNLQCAKMAIFLSNKLPVHPVHKMGKLVQLAADSAHSAEGAKYAKPFYSFVFRANWLMRCEKWGRSNPSSLSLLECRVVRLGAVSIPSDATSKRRFLSLERKCALLGTETDKRMNMKSVHGASPRRQLSSDTRSRSRCWFGSVCQEHRARVPS